MKKFNDLGLSQATLAALQKKGFEEPTPIQEQVIPLLLEAKHDVIGQAQTGTGKTAAFGLPLMERLVENQDYLQGLILAPTRELAIQVAEELNSFKGNRNLHIVPIYGGQSMREQLRRLQQGVDIIVGTPGRILDHINRKSIQLNKLSNLVLDEADEMLNMGFIDDVETILKASNPNKRILLFSATMPDRLMKIADRYMTNKKIIKVKESLTTQLTDQIYFEVAERDRFEALCRIIDVEPEFYGVVFCRTKVDVENVFTRLNERGYDAAGLHGDIEQRDREKILTKFRNQNINILVATDVAARGIDISNLSHVINYAVPQNPEAYVHRIGRTGRAGKQGTAITFITPTEYRKLMFIERITKTNIRKEKLPNIKDIIKIKATKIQNDVETVIKNNDYEDYHALAKNILKNQEPEIVLAALLKHAFQSELDIKSYSDIATISPNNSGKTRLLIARGRTHGMTPRKIIAFIKNTADIADKDIKNIEIMEKCSFVSVPFENAEIILDMSRKRKRGERAMIEKAK
jgi:ATP-dependent RNA helicase DeaD